MFVTVEPYCYNREWSPCKIAQKKYNNFYETRPSHYVTSDS